MFSEAHTAQVDPDKKTSANDATPPKATTDSHNAAGGKRHKRNTTRRRSELMDEEELKKLPWSDKDGHRSSSSSVANEESKQDNIQRNIAAMRRRFSRRNSVKTVNLSLIQGRLEAPPPEPSSRRHKRGMSDTIMLDTDSNAASGLSYRKFIGAVQASSGLADQGAITKEGDAMLRDHLIGGDVGFTLDLSASDFEEDEDSARRERDGTSGVRADRASSEESETDRGHGTPHFRAWSERDRDETLINFTDAAASSGPASLSLDSAFASGFPPQSRSMRSIHSVNLKRIRGYTHGPSGLLDSSLIDEEEKEEQEKDRLFVEEMEKQREASGMSSEITKYLHRIAPNTVVRITSQRRSPSSTSGRTGPPAFQRSNTYGGHPSHSPSHAHTHGRGARHSMQTESRSSGSKSDIKERNGNLLGRKGHERSGSEGPSLLPPNSSNLSIRVSASPRLERISSIDTVLDSPTQTSGSPPSGTDSPSVVHRWVNGRSLRVDVDPAGHLPIMETLSPVSYVSGFSSLTTSPVGSASDRSSFNSDVDDGPSDECKGSLQMPQINRQQSGRSRTPDPRSQPAESVADLHGKERRRPSLCITLSAPASPAAGGMRTVEVDYSSLTPSSQEAILNSPPRLLSRLTTQEDIEVGEGTAVDTQQNNTRPPPNSSSSSAALHTVQESPSLSLRSRFSFGAHKRAASADLVRMIARLSPKSRQALDAGKGGESGTPNTSGTKQQPHRRTQSVVPRVRPSPSTSSRGQEADRGNTVTGPVRSGSQLSRISSSTVIAGERVSERSDSRTSLMSSSGVSSTEYGKTGTPKAHRKTASSAASHGGGPPDLSLDEEEEERGNDMLPAATGAVDDPRAIVMSGSPNKLIEKLVDIDHTDLTYRSTFFLTFREFVSPMHLLKRLIKLFKYYDSHAKLFRVWKEKEGAECTADELSQLNRMILLSLKYRLKLFAVLKYWLQNNFSFDFSNKSSRADGVLETLNAFLQSIRESDTEGSVKNVVVNFQKMLRSLQQADEEEKQSLWQADIERKIGIQAEMSKRNEPTGKVNRALTTRGKATINLKNQISAISDTLSDLHFVGTESLRNKSRVIAEQLTLIEFAMFDKIHSAELSIFGWMKKTADSESPNVVAFVRRFNEVSYWVATSILCQPTSKKRIHAFRKMVKIAHECWRIGNFHAVFEIIAGLQVNAVYRLKEVRGDSVLGCKERHKLDALTKFFSARDNYSQYRSELLRAMEMNPQSGSDTISNGKPRHKGTNKTFNPHPLVLPHMAIVLKDLAGLKERDKYLADGAIDFSRCRTISSVVFGFTQTQRTPVPFKVNKKLQSSLDYEVSNALTEEQLYQLSLTIQPKA